MRILFQLIMLIFLALPISSGADGGEEYYKKLRKLKKFDPETLEKIKKETIDADQIKKVNAISRANTAHNKKVDAMKKSTPPASEKSDEAPSTGPNGEKVTAAPKMLPGKATPAKSTALKKESAKKEVAKKPSVSKSETSSEPIKVNTDGPDELSFPGTETTPSPKK